MQSLGSDWRAQGDAGRMFVVFLLVKPERHRHPLPSHPLTLPHVPTASSRSGPGPHLLPRTQEGEQDRGTCTL